jgi:hypothetical protein
LYRYIPLKPRFSRSRDTLIIHLASSSLGHSYSSTRSLASRVRLNDKTTSLFVNRTCVPYVPCDFYDNEERRHRLNMDQSLPLGDSVPAISVTSPGPSDPTSSPATLEALDDSRLAPIPPLPKASPDQRQIFTNPSIPRPVPLSVIDHSLPAYNKQFRFFSERTNFLDTRNNFSRCGIRHGACHAHSPTTFAGNEEGKDKEETGKPNDEGVEAKRNKPQKEAIPSFSSPWAPSSCSPKRVLWKEVEDYNRQRKRVRFLG